VHVTNIELLFDLVYVFAITQLSAHLYERLDWSTAGETTVMFLAVWWAWGYTAWATGWIDPDKRLVAALMAVLMILSLLMASAIPAAFGSRGLALAGAYLLMQLLRSGFLVWVFGVKDRMGRNYAQLLAWSAIAAPFWVAGGLVQQPHARLAIWAAAVIIDLTAPMHGFTLPTAGSRPIGDWDVAGGHLAERYQLVLMIAFGESVLRIGESFAQAPGSVRADAGFILGFAVTFALWSLYFLHHAPEGVEAMESSRDVARMARGAYAYAHALMVGSVIVLAVAIHMVIVRPNDGVQPSFAAVCLGGPALFLVGITLSKHWLGHGRPLPLIFGSALLALLGAVAAFSDRLAELGVATAVSVALAVWAQLDGGDPAPASADPLQLDGGDAGPPPTDSLAHSSS
jgi:low temperature requirement protein LtrA